MLLEVISVVDNVISSIPGKIWRLIASWRLASGNLSGVSDIKAIIMCSKK